MNKKLMQLGKPIFGIFLIAVILYSLNVSDLLSLGSSVSFSCLFLSFSALIISNLLSALRWRRIASLMGVEITRGFAIQTYAQGIATNTVIPGGILGGDAWRVMSLKLQGIESKIALTTVVVDRLSGVWALALGSMLAMLFALTLNLVPENIEFYWLSAYGIFVLSISLVPLFVHVLAKHSVSAIWKTGFFSIVIQLFNQLAFGLCVYAVTPNFSWILLIGFGAGIFIAAIIPLSIGGFGPRELGAVFFLSVIGIGAEAGFLASILYGLLCTGQGLLSIYYWMNRPRESDFLFK